MKKSTKLWIASPILLALTVVGLFFYKHQSYSHNLVRNQGLPGNQANAIKHAYAAADLYSKFRSFGLAAHWAQAAVESLGKLNEAAEQIIKFGKKDNDLEIMKDLHNNTVGIATAQWVIVHNCQDNGNTLPNLLLLLSKHQILANNRNKIPLSTEPLNAAAGSSQLDNALIWYNVKKADITQRVLSYLDKTGCIDPA